MMDHKTERVVYGAVFSCALLLAGLLLVYAGRMALERLRARREGSAAPTAAAAAPLPAGMTGAERPMTFIPPIRLSVRPPSRKAVVPPAIPAPPIAPDKRG